MNKNILWIVVAVIVLGGGWYIYSQGSAVPSSDVANSGESTQAASNNDVQPAGSKPDATLVLSENLQGKWQANDDAKFVREFKADGTVVDWYDNETKTSGTYQIFTQLKPITVSFPLEVNAAYVQIREAGSQSETLNFKIGLSADASTLTLTYMDRGGATTYTRVK